MSALDDLIEKHNAEHFTIKRANWQMHEQRMKECAAALGCPVQVVQGALYRVAIECNQHPDHVLHSATELIKAVNDYQAQEPA